MEISDRNTADRKASISYLRIFATICVIWLHTCSTLCDNPELFVLTHEQSIFFNASYQMMYWAVPVFFMITGALMLDPDKKISISKCLHSYTRRILTALIIFGVPYAVLKLVPQYGLTPMLLPKAFEAVICDTGFGHLWYLYVLIGIYLVLPVLKIFVKYAREEEMILVIVVLGIMDFLFPFISGLTTLSIAFNIPFSYPVFYLLLGYLLNKNREKMFGKRFVLWFVLLIVISIIWLVNYKDCHATVWTAYTSPLIALLAMAVFSLFVSHDFNYSVNIWKLDRLCFGVYLIHPLFIQFTYRYLKITPIKFDIYLAGTFTLFAVFTLLSFVSSWILMHISLLKKYVL